MKTWTLETIEGLLFLVNPDGLVVGVMFDQDIADSIVNTLNKKE